MTDYKSQLHETMAAINRAWRENRPADMRQYLHPQVTMLLPGFSGTATGCDDFLSGFEEWCANAKVVEYEEGDEQIQVVGDAGFVSFRFDMLYERATYRERSTGRDIWAFQRVDGKWLAVWRTMVDLEEERATKELNL